MTGPAPVAISWGTREPPLTPAAVTVPLGQGPVLLAALLRRVGVGVGPAVAVEVRAVAGSGRLVVLAEPGDLPWCPGAQYLGWGGGLLLPTEIAPELPVDVLMVAARRAGARQAAEGGTPELPLLAVLPDAVICAELPVRPVDVEALMALFGGGFR